MANPIAFKAPAVDPKIELNRRLDAAPTEHAEALLVAWDILQSAHNQGILDAFHGLITAKDTIFGVLAEGTKTPEAVAGIRNFISLTKMFATIDPDTLDHIAKSLEAATEEHRREQKTPSLWRLAKRARSEDSRRSLSFLTFLLARFGRALKH